MSTLSPSADGEQRARLLFEQGAFDQALTLLLSLANLGARLSPEARALLLELLSATETADSLTRLEDTFAVVSPDLTPVERTEWLARRFDLVRAVNHPLARDAALDLLAAATLAGERGWKRVQEPRCRDRINETFREPDELLELWEYESYAPAETGLPSAVPGYVLALGQSTPDSGIARSAERLLHALREPQLAYLVERHRDDLLALDAPRQSRVFEPLPVMPRIVVLAGGHPPLRSLASVDLSKAGVREVRVLPSAWEANRTTRDARDLLAGAEVAVLVWRQVAHSTSAQLKSAARALAVPVALAETPTVAAIRRAVEGHGHPPS